MKSIGYEQLNYEDIPMEGIENISQKDIKKASSENALIRLIARAEKCKKEWKLSVKPEKVDKNSFLGSCVDKEQCIQIESDLFETISMKANSTGVVPTCSAVLRDIIYVALVLKIQDPIDRKRLLDPIDHFVHARQFVRRNAHFAFAFFHLSAQYSTVLSPSDSPPLHNPS